MIKLMAFVRTSGGGINLNWPSASLARKGESHHEFARGGTKSVQFVQPALERRSDREGEHDNYCIVT